MENRKRVSVAMHADLETARVTRNLSRTQVAALLELDTRGADYGTSQLNKAVDCNRKYPHWRIADWVLVTGGDALISELARQAGGVFVPLPDDVTPVQSMLNAMRPFNDLMRATNDLTRDGRTFDDVSPEAAENVSSLAFLVVSSVLGMARAIEGATKKPKVRQLAGSIAEASRAASAKGNGTLVTQRL